MNNLLYWFLQNSFMKGQYLTVEYVIFFAIGIAMVIGIYLTFTNINTDLRQDAATMQLEKTNELIRDSIVNIYEAGNRTGADIITYELSIPPRLSGHTYVIKYDGNLNVNSTENYKIGSVLNVYSININSPNNIYSTKGEIIITYQDEQVWLS